VKEFLSQKRAAFTVRVVDEDDTAYDELLALGFRTVPVTVIGTSIVKGFDPVALTEALEDGSGPPDTR
jgi:glutaredoxin